MIEKRNQSACIWAGGGHNFALTEDGKLWTFGLGENGRLGTGNPASASDPVELSFFNDKRLIHLACGLEHTVVPGVVESLKIITKRASTRIALFAFEYARKNGRKRVTAVHKANIMKLSDGLFIECARRVAKEFPEIQYDERIVDAACMQLVMFPEKFDVLLLPNLYGDIVSDLCAGLVGGLGVVPAANLGLDGVGVFEAVHGSAPDIAGKGIANPLAAILSAALSAIDIALWDIKGRQANMPVYQVMGGKVREAADCYGHASGGEIQECVDNAKQWMSRGFRHVRVQVGVPGMSGYGSRAGGNRAAALHKGEVFEGSAYIRRALKLFEECRKQLGEEIELLHDVHERITPTQAVHTDTKASIGLICPVNASPRTTTAAVPGSSPMTVAPTYGSRRTDDAPAA